MTGENKNLFFLGPDKRNKLLKTIGGIIFFPSAILLFLLVLALIRTVIGPILIVLTLLVFVGYYFLKEGQNEPVSSSFWLIAVFVMAFLIGVWLN